MDLDELKEQIGKYMDSDGKIVSYPSKKHRSIRPYIYQYLITKFEKGKQYSEPQVNEIIKSWILFEDYCVPRREMVEMGLLARTNDGRSYWVKE